MAMKRSLVPSAKIRILVTGSRGKSSLVRLLLAGLWSQGINAKGRITGVIPRELSINKEREILRHAPGHVEEMRWWLKGLAPHTEAVVMENSAIHPQLQLLAGHWLCPTLTVWNNAREDHQEVWGYGENNAAMALLRGIPDEGALLLGSELSENTRVLWGLERRNGSVTFSKGTPGNYRNANASLAMEALDMLGLLNDSSSEAVRECPPDVADFRVFNIAGTDLACAFSANDLRSAQELLALLRWDVRKSALLYVDRKDRGARKRSFAPLINLPWRERCIVPANQSVDVLLKWAREHKRVFGCGNVVGAPLMLVQRLLGSGVSWTIPNM